MADYDIKNLPTILKRLDAIDPGLKRQLVKDAKLPARPVAQAVKDGIPDVQGLGLYGTLNSGRLGSNGKVRDNKTTIKYRTGYSRRSAVTALVSIRAESPLIQMLDLAKNVKVGGLTREYPYRGGTRRHRINGQARGLINQLPNRPSRFIWPAGEAKIPAANREIVKIVESYARKVNSEWR